MLSSFLAECSAAGTLLDHGRFLYGWVFLRFNLIVFPLGHSLFLADCSMTGHSLFLAVCSMTGHSLFLADCSMTGHSLFLAVCSAAGTLSLFLAKCSFAGAHFVAS